MASLRTQIVNAVKARIDTIAVARGFGSVNAFVRSKDEVNDMPSVDVFSGNETRAQRSGDEADRTVAVIVRCFGLPYGELTLDDDVEAIENCVRDASTLSGIVVDIFVENIISDLGWLGYHGQGPMREIHFIARWNAHED